MDAEGLSPLHAAVIYRQAKIVRYLITPDKAQCKSNSNTSDDDSEESAFYGAGVDPNQLTGNGTSALEEAHKRNFMEIVEILESAIKAYSGVQN